MATDWTSPRGPFSIENLGGFLRVIDAEGNDVCGLGDCRLPGAWESARWLANALNTAAPPTARRALPDDIDALSREAARLADGLAAEVEGSDWSFALFLYREARAEERAGLVVQVSRDRERTKLAVARWLMDLLDSQRAKARG